MKTFMKKSLAVLLAVMMLSSSFVCFAANDVSLNEEAAKAHYGQYDKYLLLGDSAASGYRDVLEEDENGYEPNDEYNRKYNQSVYTIVPGSYADIIGKAIGAETSSMAAPGYRTIEMRYMLEDDFAASCEDPYLFHPSQLYFFDDQICECHNEAMLPGSKHFRELFKKSIAEADLITLGVGGNDWGEYLKWVLNDVLEEEHVADEYIEDAEEILDKSTMDDGLVSTIVDIAYKAGALPALIEKLPAALDYGLGNFYKNWNIMIEDIYALNPDVTLMVLGMGDSGKKGYYYGYNGEADKKIEVAEQNETTAKATELVLGLILGIANGPMKAGVEKYGYTYVDTDGATYVTYHQDADGHMFIANKVLEALPDREISKMFSDVKVTDKYYDAVEYVIANGIMAAKEEGKFAPDAVITKGDFAAALNVINGTDNDTDNTKDATAIHLMFAFIKGATQKGAAGFFKTLALAMKVVSDNNFNLGAGITRAAAAQYLTTFANI